MSKEISKEAIKKMANMTDQEWQIEKLKQANLLKELRRTTPVLITELIGKFRYMSDDAIYEALSDIRCSAEVDEQTKEEYRRELDLF
jgi:hypothetical protein